MIFKKFLVTDHTTNCYLIGDESSGEVLIIDPGASNDKLINLIDKENYSLKYIVLTHGHFDHSSGVAAFKEKYNPKIAIHRADAAYLNEDIISKYTPVHYCAKAVKPDILLDDGDILSVGKFDFRIIQTPGHTKGSICLLCDNILFSGDTLFRDSVGRTDFIDGDFNELKDSIQELYMLDDNINVYPGHGLRTTMGWEKKNNPYIKAL